jgi:hypothetical protein
MISRFKTHRQITDFVFYPDHNTNINLFSLKEFNKCHINKKLGTMKSVLLSEVCLNFFSFYFKPLREFCHDEVTIGRIEIPDSCSMVATGFFYHDRVCR